VTPDSWTVECVGTCALVSLWQAEDLPIKTSFTLGKYGGSILGNDAVIVARELTARGINAKCRLISPSVADLALLRSRLCPSAVSAVGECDDDELTRSLCLEHSSGQRSWIFSRLLQPNGPVGRIDADVVYLDLYPELIEFFNRSLESIALGRLACFVNLSTVADVAAIRPLTFVPSIAQASILGKVEKDESLNVAARLLGKIGARQAFVTMGHRGAALAEGSKTWYATAPFTKTKSVLGAGAIFSSNVITGSLHGLSGRELLEFSVRETAARLQSWQTNDEGDCS
jgi:hypothetical protein